tara:strand:- start:9341 stop:10003 length:663 start_codon:yes stop_codon:yes gene_type:complete
MEYIDDLLAQLKEEDARAAYDEARELADEAYLQRLEQLAESASSHAEVEHIAFLVSAIAKNANSQMAKDLFIKLVDKCDKLSAEDKMNFIDRAMEHENEYLLPFVEQWIAPILDAPHWTIGWIRCALFGDDHYIQALEYLGKFGGKRYLHRIGRNLDRDCNRRIDPSMAVLALEEIGEPEAIPYLKRVIAKFQHLTEDGIEADPVKYARDAIETLTKIED